jgi:N-acetylmuramoyl-L-alanine amidase
LKGKSFIVVALLFSTFFFFLESYASAYTVQTGTVITNTSLNVRENPSNDAPVIGQLQSGAKVEYVDVGYDWVRITYNGKAGYLNSLFIKENRPTSQAMSHQATSHQATAVSGVNVGKVTAKNGLIVRTQASTDSAMLGKIDYGSKVEYRISTGGWGQITYNGQQAFIDTSYLSGSTSNENISGATSNESKSVDQQAAVTGTISRVVIDPGHGGRDPGARGNGLIEKNITLLFAKQIKKSLQENGIEVYLTRSSDEYVYLQERANIADSFQADLFLSIHANGHENSLIRGMEIHSFAPNNIALKLENQFRDLPNAVYRGHYESNFYVLRNTSTPSLLIELGYVSNQADAALLQSQQFQIQVGEAVRRALQS